jgi:hypothetical protein
MLTEILSAADAVERIRSGKRDGGQVLGVDGFQIVPEGHVGRLDLILDLSICSVTPEAAEAAALEFVTAHAADDIMFEVVVGRPRGVS